MSWFDIGALVVVLLAVLDGATSGFAWAGLEAVVLLGSALASRLLRDHAAPYVSKVAALPAADLPWVTHLILFALSACSLFGILMLVHPAAKKWRFRNDRWFGGAMGLVNGGLAAIFIFAMTMAATDKAWEDQARTSRLLHVVDGLSRTPAAGLLPDHVQERAARLQGK